MPAFRRCLPLPLLVAFAATSAEPAAQDGGARREFAVALHDGRLDVAALAHALLDAYGLDGCAVELPPVQVDLRGARGLLVLAAARRLLLHTVRFSRDLDRQQLRVVIDRTRTRELRRDLRRSLARVVGLLAGGDVTLDGCRLDVPAANDRDRPLVVLVHGVESGPSVFDDLRAFLRRQDPALQVATFAYPDDASIDHAASELARELRALGGQRVRLVGHSMGGLVARAVVEEPDLDPGVVDTLIQIGTPNHGSELAAFRVGLELAGIVRDGVAAGRDGDLRTAELLDAVFDAWRDGLGEAGGDLQPDSVFLHGLAARPRNPRVDYHLVLGTRSLLSAGQLAGVRRRVAALFDADAGLARMLRPRVEQWLADLDELQDGQGDGAVSVARGRLDGVEPVLVPLDHVGLVRCDGLLGADVAPGEHPVFALVARWLQH